MPLSYQSPWWAKGRHLQTLFPASWISLPKIAYRREQWNTPDGDVMELDWVDGALDKPLCVLFHGLEGNSNSHYALRLMSILKLEGWRGVVVHFRGCGGTPNLLPRAYYCGDSAEIDWILRRLRSNESNPMYVVGVSLGGNALLKWLGEQQSAAKNIVAKAVAVSAPLALSTTGHVLSHGFNRLYCGIFLKTMRPKALAMIARHKLNIDVMAIKNVRNLWHFEELFTAPLHGFKNADELWQVSNSRPFLKTIEVPTLLINARNDPFLPQQALPTKNEISNFVIRDFPKHGGHAGFPDSKYGAEHNRRDWLPGRILCFLEHGN